MDQEGGQIARSGRLGLSESVASRGIFFFEGARILRHESLSLEKFACQISMRAIVVTPARGCLAGSNSREKKVTCDIMIQHDSALSLHSPGRKADWRYISG